MYDPRLLARRRHQRAALFLASLLCAKLRKAVTSRAPLGTKKFPFAESASCRTHEECVQDAHESVSDTLEPRYFGAAIACTEEELLLLRPHDDGGVRLQTDELLRCVLWCGPCARIDLILFDLGFAAQVSFKIQIDMNRGTVCSSVDQSAVAKVR